MDPKKLQQLNEARVFQIAGNAIMPLLERRKSSYMQKLLGAYREGSREYHNTVAQLVVIDDLIGEIRRKTIESEHLQEEFNNG